MGFKSVDPPHSGNRHLIANTRFATATWCVLFDAGYAFLGKASPPTFRIVQPAIRTASPPVTWAAVPRAASMVKPWSVRWLTPLSVTGARRTDTVTSLSAISSGGQK